MRLLALFFCLPRYLPGSEENPEEKIMKYCLTIDFEGKQRSKDDRHTCFLENQLSLINVEEEKRRVRTGRFLSLLSLSRLPFFS